MKKDFWPVVAILSALVIGYLSAFTSWQKAVEHYQEDFIMAFHGWLSGREDCPEEGEPPISCRERVLQLLDEGPELYGVISAKRLRR